MTVASGLRVGALKVAAVVVVLCLASVAQASADLLVNGSGELSPFDENGWTKVTDGWAQRSSAPSPVDGSAYFSAGTNATAELYQDIDVSAYSAAIGLGHQLFTFAGYLAGWGSDDMARVVVEYRDSGGGVLSSYDTGDLTSSQAWLYRENTTLAPANTTTIRVRLISTKNAGTNNDGYYDNLSLVALQAPMAARVDVNPRSGTPTASITNQTTGANLWVGGGNEGDFFLGYPGDSVPILQSNGVIIANCNELTSRTDRGGVAVVGNSSWPGGSSFNGGMWIASFTSAGNTGNEDNYDFSFGWFPYTLGWIGGHINAAGTGFDGSGNLPAGSTVSNAVSGGVHEGEYLLTLDGIDPRTDGMLFVVDGRNGDNVAVAGVPSLDTIEGSNSWHIAAFDESANFDTYEQGQVSFLYVPYSTEGLCGGWIGSDGTKKESRGEFSVTRAGTGQYELVIPDDAGGYHDDGDGILLLTVAKLIENGATGDGNGVDDNAIAWAYDAAANGGDGAFVVETYDLYTWGDQDTEFVFAFVRYDGLLDVPGPPLGTIFVVR